MVRSKSKRSPRMEYHITIKLRPSMGANLGFFDKNISNLICFFGTS